MALKNVFGDFICLFRPNFRDEAGSHSLVTAESRGQGILVVIPRTGL